MIFVTVGTQLPFDRLVKAIDELAPTLGRRVFAQTSEGRYTPRNIEWKPFIRPLEVDGFFQEADIIVAHAGIGTILTARKLGKPVIIMPRVAALGEHRNDHQQATAGQLEGRPGIHVARDEAALARLLAQPLSAPDDVNAPNANRDSLRAHLSGLIAQSLSGT